jgi:hypothetical protein
MAIDDTGTPGQSALSVHLHPQRKTWAAVLLPPEDMAEISRNLPATIQHVCSHLGVDELHFSEIYSGRGALRKVPFDSRLDAFRIFARVFAVFRLPLLVQTFSPDNILDQSEALARFGKVAGVFDLRDPSDLAFVALLWRVRQFVAANKGAFHKPALALVDEGRFRAGLAVELGSLLEFAHQNALFIAGSREMGLLQLADFAAFSINRMQWLLAKTERSDADQQLLEVLGQADFQGIDMISMAVDSLAGWTTAEFDSLHESIRAERGLHPLPGHGRT